MILTPTPAIEIRSASYEEELITARTQAMQEMSDRASRLGADAVVGTDIDYEVLGGTAAC